MWAASCSSTYRNWSASKQSVRPAGKTIRGRSKPSENGVKASGV
jgi:hypothetical protein